MINEFLTPCCVHILVRLGMDFVLNEPQISPLRDKRAHFILSTLVLCSNKMKNQRSGKQSNSCHCVNRASYLIKSGTIELWSWGISEATLLGFLSFVTVDDCSVIYPDSTPGCCWAGIPAEGMRVGRFSCNLQVDQFVVVNFWNCKKGTKTPTEPNSSSLPRFISFNLI